MKCEECGGRIIRDRENYCEDCGLVQYEELFADTYDRPAPIHTLVDKGLSTTISYSVNNDKAKKLRFEQKKNIYTSSEKLTHSYIRQLKTICLQLEVNSDVENYSLELYKKYRNKIGKGKVQRPIMFACVVLAARHYRIPVFEDKFKDVKNKDFRKFLKIINKDLKLQPLTVDEYIAWGCNNLKLNPSTLSKSLEFSKKIKDNFSSPPVTAAAVIYIVDSENVTQRALADLFCICDATIRNRLKDTKHLYL